MAKPIPTLVNFYDRQTQDADGNPTPISSFKFAEGKIKAEGRLAESVLDTARRRLWTDEQIMQYYSSWSNGYVWSSTK